LALTLVVAFVLHGAAAGKQPQCTSGGKGSSSRPAPSSSGGKAPAPKPPTPAPSAGTTAPAPHPTSQRGPHPSSGHTGAQRAYRQPAPPRISIVGVHTHFHLQAGDEVLVRTAEAPPKFDDKGNLQQYTPEELKQLRGDRPELPGFPADWDNVKQGQVVLVYMTRRPPAPQEGEKPDAKEKESGPFPGGTDRDAGKAEGKEAGKAEKGPAIVPVGALGGVLMTWEGETKKFTLRVDALAQAGKVPKIDPNAVVKDLQVGLVLILK
jgi:hypothetical protein